MADSKPTTPIQAGPKIHDDVKTRADNVTAVRSQREVPVWEADDAPAGSTAASLLRYERGTPIAVAEPTHYHHLANGNVVTGYSGGTHYTEVDDDGNDRIIPITRVYAG